MGKAAKPRPKCVHDKFPRLAAVLLLLLATVLLLLLHHSLGLQLALPPFKHTHLSIGALTWSPDSLLLATACLHPPLPLARSKGVSAGPPQPRAFPRLQQRSEARPASPTTAVVIDTLHFSNLSCCYADLTLAISTLLSPKRISRCTTRPAKLVLQKSAIKIPLLQTNHFSHNRHCFYRQEVTL